MPGFLFLVMIAVVGYAAWRAFAARKAPHVHDNEGRILTAEFADFFLVNVYVPNSKRELTRLPYRQQWDRDFLKFLHGLERTKPVVFCGDLNTVPASYPYYVISRGLQDAFLQFGCGLGTTMDSLPKPLRIDYFFVDKRISIKNYVKNGVKLVWLVDPEFRSVTVYSGSLRGTELDESETITGGDVLPEFMCKVAEFFE